MGCAPRTRDTNPAGDPMEAKDVSQGGRGKEEWT